MPIFDACKVAPTFDEMFDKDCNVKEHWQKIVNDIEKLGIEKLEEKQQEIDWRLEDNGVTFNIYNDPEGSNRVWKLDPIPFVLTENEWDEVSKGLAQRAKLLNLIFKDLYNEQNLIKEGIVPAEIIFSHKSFTPEVCNFENKDYYTMKFYAADISRGPDGKFWLINDKTQSPSGLGYAIENRLTMNSISNELYPDVDIKKIITFIEDFKIILKELIPTDSKNPLITLLTPGPHNETYFEHSYLSSFLDLTLVQGEDLLTKNNQLWLKGLSGLKKVDAMIRRVDSEFCDPLELKNDSFLGVAGLVNVLRENNLSMINPIGIGILENIGLNPFMKNICKYFLNEDLILPQIATWWCGQKEELDFVIKNIQNLIIKKIDKTKNLETYLGNKLSKEEIELLIKRIKKNPYQYVGQEIIDFSTVPSFNDNKIEPRNAVIRAFSLLKNNNFEVMPSGLVRVSSSKDSLVVSNQRGGTSKDLWILGKSEEIIPTNIFKNREFVDSRLENISTKRAENLFWLGRYLTRAISTARIIRFNLKSILNIDRYEDNTNAKTITELLNRALTHLTMTYPGFLEEDEKITPINEILDLIKNSSRAGTLSFTLSLLANINANIKNLLTIDAWRIYEKMQKEWFVYSKKESSTFPENINQLDNLLIYLIAYKELIDESIFKEQGLILYDIGCKMEMAQLLISKLRSLLTYKLDTILEYDILDSMLNSYESYNSYRVHYKSSLNLKNVLDFLIFNTQYPKSLIYLIKDLETNLKELPKSENLHLSNFEEPIFKAFSLLSLSSSDKLLEIKEEEFIYKDLDSFLSQILDLIMQASDELTKTYFSHISE